MALAPVDQKQFRTLMASVCAPVAIVTTTVDTAPRGATVSSFASLSLDPPLVSVALDHRSTLLSQVLTSKRFGINVLSHAQDRLAMLFAQRGADRFADALWQYDAGMPRLDGAAGWCVCDLYETVEAGDHLLLFGLVTKAVQVDCAPLIYAHRTFGTHTRYAERPRTPMNDYVAAFAR